MAEPVKTTPRAVLQNTKVCVGLVTAVGGAVALFSPAAGEWLKSNSEAVCVVLGGLFSVYGVFLEKKGPR